MADRTTDPGRPVLLSGWGRTASSRSLVNAPDTEMLTARVVRTAGPRGVLARGAGRSYGDAAQNAGGTVLQTARLNGIGGIDPDGVIACGAGVTVDALLRHIVPRGYSLAVTPGTRQVTLGGAFAFDVHGKNHPVAGTFADHVRSIRLVDGTGVVQVLRPHDDLFRATAGGMGMTGVIVELEVRLKPVETAWLRVDTHRTADLDAAATALDNEEHESAVAWLDCLHATYRGVVSLASAAARDSVQPSRRLEWAPRSRTLPMPWAPPNVLTPARVAAFNRLHFHRAPERRTGQVVHADDFHYPLDSISNWNRFYGTRGFLQHQFATPSLDTVHVVLDRLRTHRAPAFLAVLKRFGRGSDRPLSFPAEGWTLALDLPADPSLASMLDDLDGIVADAGGRVYLAKDARLRPGLLHDMYPRLAEWRSVRAAADPDHRFRSDLSRRLGL